MSLIDDEYDPNDLEDEDWNFDPEDDDWEEEKNEINYCPVCNGSGEGHSYLS